MEINADFSRRVVIHGGDLPWIASPQPGVERRLFDRIGDEVARATSLVRYSPGSTFKSHTHGGGEEFFVLEGAFADEHGTYPTGSYVRNPPTSSHTPSVPLGCTIFVKLWQMAPDDRIKVRLHADDLATRSWTAARPGVEEKALFVDSDENVRLERWSSNTRVETPVAARGGLELLVLEGSFELAGGSGGMLSVTSWLREPEGAPPLVATAGPVGCTLWVKSGHSARRREAPVLLP